MQQPVTKAMPVAGPDGGVKSIGKIYRDAIPLFIREEALEDIIEFSHADLTRERGGFLVGGFHQDKQPYVEIRHFLPAVETKNRPATLTFTHDTWATLNRQVETQYPHDLVVGWHHTHPDFGIFLSGYDLFIHRHFFSEPWQVAMVVDPARCELGIFQWRDGDVKLGGFTCVGTEVA